MSELKEKDEKRSRKEEREKQQQQRARELNATLEIRPLPSAFERGITRRDLVNAAVLNEMSAAEVMDWQRYMESVGWRLKDGVCVSWRNFRRSLRMWHKKQIEIDARKDRRGGSAEREAEKRKAAEKAKEAERVKAAAKPGAWQLCRERCAFAEVCGCAKKHLIPPQLRSYPIPPQDCKDYEPKEGGAE